MLSAESQVQTRLTLSTVLTHLSATLFVDCLGVYRDGCNAKVIANIQYQAQKLAESSTILADLIQAGKLKIMGGQYDLQTGEFTIVT